jgi:DNA-binding response OmpR family regulator
MSRFIAIIEDEEDILELIEYQLQKNGYETEGFLSTKNVERFLEEESVDLLIVDRNLPGIEGSEFVKGLRDVGFQIPVLFLSAKDQDKDIEEGFLRGGDDYLTKPFNMNELILRVKAILRRTSSSTIDRVVKHRDITLDMESRSVKVDGLFLDLTKLEFELLLTLIKNKGRVLDRDFLLDNVWKDESYLQDKTVNVAVNRLKKKLDPDKEKEYIKSVWGVGYTIQ